MIGQTVSHYKILEKLGEGGMGVVYKAEDTKLGRTVALKFLRPELTRDPGAKERFIQEARAASALEHQNICVIHEIDEADDGQMFICMGCYEGETLKAKLAGGPLGVGEAVDIAVQTAEGLARAHDRDIVHRDIKPANIFVTREGQVKIVDFGLAKLAGQIRLTKTGTTVGTVAYMSPEQARGEEVDHRTDVWSLGVVLYEMLAGKLPFRGEHEQAVIYSILNETPPPLTEALPGAPAELSRAVERATAKRPEDRYPRVLDFLADLRRVQHKLEEEAAAASSSTQQRRSRRWGILAAAVVAVVAAVFISRFVFPPESAGRIDSIAVLPLDNLSGDPAQEYFSDGMTEALIADLAKIGALKVISRTSVMRFKETDKSLPQIARELGVDAIVEGSVLLTGERVRITAQLIEAATDRHIWAEQYERDMGDVIDMQREVARAIAKEVQVQLTPQEQEQLAVAKRVNAEAQKAYLKGRYYWNRRTEEGIKKSIDYFESAIEFDSTHALAYSGLADAYIVAAVHGFWGSRRLDPKTMTYARKALEFDENLAEAHVSLGAALQSQYDWIGAEREFKRAIELKPGYATAHQWYAELLSVLLRHSESLEEIKRAFELDPLSIIINSSLGWILYLNGRTQDALDQFQNVFEMDPDFFVTHYVRYMLYIEQKMYDEAVEEEAYFIRRLGFGEEYVDSMKNAYRTSGMGGVYRWVVEKMTAFPDFQDPYEMAANYAALGENDRAFEWLDREDPILIVTAITDARYDPIRADPRYAERLRHVGLEPEQ